MTTDQYREAFDFALNFGQEFVYSIAHMTFEPLLRGWSMENTADGWVCEVFLQSPDQHGGQTVSVHTPVPASEANLGLDLGSYIQIQASGAVEDYRTQTPETSQRLRYVSDTE